jgi:hypothetical protein
LDLLWPLLKVGDYQNGRTTEEQWQQAFQNSKAAALRAMGSMDTQKVMGIMFDRLYTLRNQLLHGGAHCYSPDDE